MDSQTGAKLSLKGSFLGHLVWSFHLFLEGLQIPPSAVLTKLGDQKESTGDALIWGPLGPWGTILPSKLVHFDNVVGS